MLQAVIIHTEQSYTVIPWTSIVRAEYFQKPYSTGKQIYIQTSEHFKLTVLGSDSQILQCLVFGGESADILNKRFQQLGTNYVVANVNNSDVIDNFLIR